jgi:hypothetical protein
MYVVSQITPLEWRRASVCSHEDSDGGGGNDELHLCKNSLNSSDGHEHFMNSTEADGGGNCCENYSTLERYLQNASEQSEDNDAWMSNEARRNFEQPETRPARNFDENLDIDDDGLIGFEPAHQSSFSSCANDGHDEHDEHNIELISYENNFNLYNSFWWAMGTLIQTTSDLNPKVFASHSNLPS